MRHTPTLKLKLPDPTDYVIVEDINENMEKIDEEITKISDPTTGVEAKLTKHLDEKASTTKYGHTKLNSATNSPDETTSATPKAVKVVADGINSLLSESRKYTVASATVNQSIASGSIQHLLFDTLSNSNGADFCELVGGKVRVNKSGIYEIHCQIQFVATSSTAPYLLDVMNTKSGSNFINGGFNFKGISTFVQMTSGAYITATIEQYSGGALDLISSGKRILIRKVADV